MCIICIPSWENVEVEFTISNSKFYLEYIHALNINIIYVLNMLLLNGNFHHSIWKLLIP